jgi:hypothetical protein
MLLAPQSLAVIIIIIIIIDRDSLVGITAHLGLNLPGIESQWIFRSRPFRPWCRPSFLFNENQVFPGRERPVGDVDGPPLLPPGLVEEKSYTFAFPLGFRGLL